MGRSFQVSFLKTLPLPNRVALARYKAHPALGPCLLFFTGGTALRGLSQRLIEYTHNSIHLIPPFDSGGSSAELRKQFNMLAVGDLRNRLMALADQTLKGNPEIYRLFDTRLPENEGPEKLAELLSSLLAGKHPLIAAIQDPMRKIIRNHLGFFKRKMPADFDLRGASIGNLILVGGYLNNRRQIDPVLYLFARLIEARGIVRPSATQDLQLLARYADGTEILGQHRFTGKGSKPPAAKLVDLELANKDGSPARRPPLKDKIAHLIDRADLICYPMGSFFSSLLANFLIQGVGDRVQANPCPKVYVPNLGVDPEQKGYRLAEQVDRLLRALKESSRFPGWDTDYLNFLVIDAEGGHQITPEERDQLENRGIQIIDVPLVLPEAPERIDEELLLSVLLSLA
ncbi:MAG: GAK system CofD-like protein [bacterium]|nr:GAK system CofD-like protein [bacterium]